MQTASAGAVIGRAAPGLRGAETSPARFAALSKAQERKFEAMQLDVMYQHVASAAIISSILATVLAFFLAPHFGAWEARVWLGAKIAVAAARYGVALLYRKSVAFDARPRTARLLMLVLLALDGAVWGFAGAWGADETVTVVCLMCAVLASVALMATQGLHAMWSAGAAYIVPMLLPMTVVTALRGDELGGFAAAGLSLVLLQALVTGRASERRLRREFVAHEAVDDARQAAARTASQLEAALVDLKKQGAAKAMFLGTMSHELRTPLHGILGLTQLVRQRVTDTSALSRLGLIENSANHLVELVSAVLDVARIDSGRLELHETPFDLAAELRNLGDLYELRSQAKGISFQTVVAFPTPTRVVGDAARIRQVLHNLLGNALKFTRVGMIQLKAARVGDQYIFHVSDTGLGIDPKDIERIFEPFGQADDSATRPADGTGLGLTIARELARAMRGDIDVTSAIGVGSRFTFTCKLSEAPAESHRREQAAIAEPRLRSGYRVLLVEDNEVNAMIATAQLEQMGATVTRATNGHEGVDAALADPRPDLILMDCRMPVMDGPTAAKIIRDAEQQAGTPRVPIIAVTASPNDSDWRECSAAGMNHMLTKPFTPAQLREAVTFHSGTPTPSHPLYEFALSLEDMEPDLFDTPDRR